MVESVIGCAVDVHRTLGPGFFEPIYHNALRIEFGARGIAFESEKRVVVPYRGQSVGTQRLDFSYLRGTGMRVGLLMNFGGMSLRSSLKRIVV